MRHVLALVSVLVLSVWCAAQTPAPSTVWWEVPDDNSSPLPAYMTPEEQQLPLPPVVYDGRTPPTGAVYCPPEYAPCQGLFIAWEGYTAILTELTVQITTHDPVATVYVVVDTTTEQSSVYSTLSGAGADMSQVGFIVRTTDTVWIRDYGPRFIFEDGNRAIIDHTYNRPRPNDDAFNDYLSVLWGEPQYDIPLTHGGGNFHLFSNRDAFMTTLILNENPGLTAQDVKDLYQAYQGVNLTIYQAFPSSFDSTQHIDMWMFPLGDYKVIIGQYASSAGQPYTITESVVADLTARGYTVYRTPGWSAGGTHYTYTNATVLNNEVFISKFGGSYASQDAQALAVFQAAMPGYRIHQIDCSSIIGAAGALHCIVMHVPRIPSHLKGDLNCDGVVSFADINPFVLLLSDLSAWQNAFPGCPKLNGDVNNDSLVNFRDINPFVALLVG
jgi:agmatine/peptidylarginine deiminase